MRGETERQDVRHQWRCDNQDQHSRHETRHLTSECARSLLVSSCCRHTHSLHTTSRGSSGPRVCTHLIHAWSERHSSTLSPPFHPTSSSLHSPSISRSSCCPSTSTRISSNTVYSANKEMGSTDESYFQTENGLFLCVHVDDINLTGKKENIDPMWKVLNKEVDLGEPTSILDHVYLGCTQRQCEISKDIVDNYRTMFESRISAVRTEKITMLGKSVYLFVVLWHGRSCKEMCGAILWVMK